MKIKAIISVSLAAVMLMALAACKDNTNTDKGNHSGSASSVVSESSSASVNSPSNDTSTVKPAEDNSSEAASSSKPAAASNDSKDSSVKEDWKVEFEKSLMEQYGLKPHHYVDLGNGIYEVYVEREGKIISFVTVDSATGDYHG